MSIEIDDIEVLHRYAQRVTALRINHHGRHLGGTFLCLIGAVVTWKANGENMQVREYDGEMGLAVTLEMAWGRLCLAYNRNTREIELRNGNVQGQVIRSFDGTETKEEIFDWFNDRHAQHTTAQQNTAA